jgi:hypothetical protein
LPFHEAPDSPPGLARVLLRSKASQSTSPPTDLSAGRCRDLSLFNKEMLMSLSPTRISAFGPLSPGREVALARQLLQVQSDRELEGFLPLLAAAAPMIANVAGPLLKNLAGGLFGGGGSKRKRPRDEQEQFLGGLLKGLMGGELEAGEQEQFLGGLIGKLFGRRELETNYVQEQFLGGLLKGIMGGEMEMEGEAGNGHGGRHLMRRARRFVRFVHTAAAHAAAALANVQRAGRRAPPAELQKIVFGALVSAAHEVLPHLAAAAFGGEPTLHSPPFTGATSGTAPGTGVGTAGTPPATMLELMVGDARPLGSGRIPQRGSNGVPTGYPLG